MVQNEYVTRRCSEIEEMLRYASEKSRNDADLGGHLAGYISVLISGVVEDCIEHLVIERARISNDSELQEFVKSSIARQFRNPKSEDIANLLSGFSGTYRSLYNNSVEQESKEALGSIITNRMALAHRGEPQSNFTIGDVHRYFDLIVKILEVVESILLPLNSP